MRPMSSDADLDPHATDDHHAPDDHGDDHGHSDDEQPLGPVDRAAWGAGVLGVVIGLVIAMCFVLATSLPG